MSDQLDVFAAPPWAQYGHPFTREPMARSSDPDTSREAAAAYLPHAKAQQAQIHAYLIGVGPGGATAREIATALGWTLEQVDRRMSEMRDAAMVSTYNRRPGGRKPSDGPGDLEQDADHAPRDRCAVHIARAYAQLRAA